MYHPTPYCWTTDENLTHVFYDNYMPPKTGFGWSSLCSEMQLPIEGEHFELIERVTKNDINCGYCQKHPKLSHTENSSVGSVDGCIVRFDRNDHNEIVQAEPVCNDILHYSLPFEPNSFTGNLNQQVKEVCSKCWKTYVDHQWDRDNQGGELRIEVWGENERTEYFSPSAETDQGEHDAVLRLVSENGLEKTIQREEIVSITLTPTQHINY